MTAALATRSVLPASRLARVAVLSGAVLVVALLALGAGLSGARLVTRPAALPGPEMAAQPVILPDGRALQVMRYEVTVAEWNRCHDAGGCDLHLTVRAGNDPAVTPATGINFIDAQQYRDWINTQGPGGYRLPRLDEWQAIARPVLPEAPDPIFTDPALRWASAYLLENTAPRRLRPQGSFAVSPQGVADLDGSVWEWTQSCVQGDDVPEDRCAAFHVGGEHTASLSYLVRDPARGGCATGTPPAHLGLRLVRDLRP